MLVREPLLNRPRTAWRASLHSWTMQVLVSRDGGASWVRPTLPGVDTERLSGDPWLAWAEDGTLYLSGIGHVQGAARRAEALLFRSGDGGLTWAPAESIPFEQPHRGATDHPVIRTALDRLYVFATGPVSPASVTSTGPAGAFETLPTFTPDDQNNNLGSGVPFDDGSFVFSYYSMSVPQPSALWAVRFSEAERAYQRVPITDEHIPITFPMMAVDRSDGPTRDRTYAVWTRSYDVPHVMVAYSDDRGASWSAARAAAPRDSNTYQFGPNIAVGEDGRVAVVWVEGALPAGLSTQQFVSTLEDDKARACWDVYATVSFTGGESFLPAVRLTPETTCSDAAGNGVTGLRWPFGGDYIGLAWDSQGAFRPTWVDSRTGTYQVWTVKALPTAPGSRQPRPQPNRGRRR
jgi:hypothetical protein